MLQPSYPEILQGLPTDADSIYLLPRERVELDNDELYVYENETDTIRKVLASKDVQCQLATEDDSASIAVERSVEIGIPALAVSYALYRENKDVIKTAIRSIGDYYIAKAEREVDITIKQETADSEWETFQYKGHPDDLDTVLSEIDEELDHDD